MIEDEPHDELDLEGALSVPVPELRRGQEPIEHIVRIRNDGMRLDQYIHMYYQEHSRSDLQDGIRSGSITVNGKPSKPSYKVRSDDKLLITLPTREYDLPEPEDIPLEVLYEDEDLALINKPWNMVVHPAKGNWSGTLVNALQFRFRDELSKANGSFRPGIVHRLDKDTSGVILVAKSDGTHRDLGHQFESRKIFKEYVSIVAGELDRDSDYIEAAMKLHPHDRVRMMVSTDADAKDAVSYYEVLERFRGFTLVKMNPKTGRTHQIRVHLQHIGHPVLADKVYSGRDKFLLSEVSPGEPATPLMTRQALHAFRLRFKHPKRGTWMEVEAPLPPDMRQTPEALRRFRAR
ncbi:MAG: RluA family pseudouridine synthase [Gemmataceae bacterium]